MRVITAAYERWDRFWFEPASPTNLGVSRALLYGALFLFYLPQDFSVWGEVSPAFRQPIWFFERLGVPFLSAPVLHALQIIWKTSLATAALGLFTRASCLVAAALGVYLLGLPHNFGQIYHFDAGLVLVFGILVFARCGDACSIDALRAAARHPGRSYLPSGEYTWPIRMVWLVLALVFFAAGVAKLWMAGLDWITSDQMAILLDRFQYHISDADPLTAWGSHVAQIPWAAHALAAGTILFETGYPLALLRTPLRPIIVVGGIALLIGIRVLMGPTFEHFMVLNVFWIRWDAVAEWLRERIPDRRTFHVFYDGACGLCRPTVAVLRRLDVGHRIVFLDVGTEWGRIHALAPKLTRERALTDMYALGPDGRMFAGFDAYRALAAVLPALWCVRPFLFLSPLPAIGRRVYRHIADRRSSAACAISEPDAFPAISRGGR